jgi:hypothetical protein
MAAERAKKTAKVRGRALTECKTHRLCQPVGPSLRPTKTARSGGWVGERNKAVYNSLGVDSPSLNFVSIPKDVEWLASALVVEIRR